MPDHRPLGILAGLVTAAVLAGRVAAQSDPASAVIAGVNALRASNGLPAYQVDAALMTAAQAHADWMAAHDIVSHTGAGGTSPNDRAQAANYGGAFDSRATENIATGTLPFVTPQWVVTLWQGDAIHLRAMLSPDYEHIGVGYAENDGQAYYSMMAGWVADAPPPDNAQNGAASPSQPEPQTLPPPPTPTPSFIVATPGPDGSVVHQVREGDSLWLIAAYYEVELDGLMALNGLSENALLQPGDVVIVRPPQQNSEVAEAETAAPDQRGQMSEAAPTARPLASPYPTQPAQSITAASLDETEHATSGAMRQVAVFAVVGLAATGASLIGWGWWRRRAANEIDTNDHTDE